MSFDHNKKLLDHKKRSDNPNCSLDLKECQFCGTLALNEYGITVHQRSDIDCMRRQNAIDSTNVVLSDARDGPLSKQQHQLDYNDEPFEDAGLFEIYGSNVTDNSNTKESTHDQDNANKCAVSSSNTEELFVLDQDSLHHPSRTTTGQRKRHVDPIIFDVPPPRDGTVVDSEKINRRIKKVSRGLSNTLPNAFITAELFYRECVRNDIKIKINVDKIEAQDEISNLESVICKVFRLTDFGCPDNAGHIDMIIRQFYDSICDCPDATNLGLTINQQHLYAFLETNGIIVRDTQILPLQDDFNLNEDEQDEEDERDAANALDIHESDSDEDTEFGHNPVNLIVTSVEQRLLSWQREIKNVRENTVFDKSDTANIELFDILRTSGAPKYLFESIQQWSAKHAYALSSSNAVKRSTFVRRIRNKVYGNDFSKHMEPNVEDVYLSHGARIPVVYFLFRASLASLLSNVELMKDKIFC